ncbi:hypothetical protein RIF29_03518 [Crotalaria pallida]|uniref:F-box domain-containing protein n=1 Tax=Crotalaria pallida TaxID=3830 RepID=A0AAN9P9V7_CROPI
MEFHNLPEDCIANILSFTTPRDACAMSLVSSTFRSAAKSNIVWERFLPSDYHTIIPSSLRFDSKKDLYLYLSHNSILIENGQKSFSLEKANGKKCYMLSARSLLICFGDTPLCFWGWGSLPESRFTEVVNLLCVRSFKIKGRINTCMLSTDTLYGAYLVFKSSSSGSYGFEYDPAMASIEISRGGDSKFQLVYLDASRSPSMKHFRILTQVVRRIQAPPPLAPSSAAALVGHTRDSIPHPVERIDGWWEIEIGDFFNKGGEENEVEMGVDQVHVV